MTDRVFSRLAELAGRYAPMGAEVNRSLLLRDLSGTRLQVRGPSAIEEIGILPGHVFISYVREDTSNVDRLQSRLQAAGVRVWRDTADLWPGEDWRAEIRRAITDSALVFIACFSRNRLSRKVSYQNEELTVAIDQMRLRRRDDPWLIPVRFDDCDIPERDIGGGRTLASLQRADLFGDQFDEGSARLVAAILRILGRQASSATAGAGESPSPDADILTRQPEKIDGTSNVGTPIASDEDNKVEFRPSLDQASSMPPPNLTTQSSRAIIESRDSHLGEDYERIVVYVGEPPAPEAFNGTWLVAPDEDETRTSEDAYDAGAYWGVALTQRGKIAVYIAHVNERWAASLKVYDSLDEAELDEVPRDILAKAAIELGEERVIWRDI